MTNWNMNENLREIIFKYLEITARAAGFPEPQNIFEIIGAIISVFLSWLGIIFVILVIYAGFTWMTSMGNEYKVIKAKNTLIQATIGLLVIVSAYAITYFVFNAVSTNLR